MDNKFEKLADLIESLDNLAHALQLPVPAQMHVDGLKDSLPETVQELKNVFVELTGENPWD